MAQQIRRHLFAGIVLQQVGGEDKRRKLLEIEFSFAFYLSICRLFECYFLNYKHTANNLYRFLITKKFQFLIFYIDNIIPFSCQDFFSLAINPL